jgi:hypothetical protein
MIMMEKQTIERIEARMTVPAKPTTEFAVGEKRRMKELHGMWPKRCDGIQSIIEGAKAETM